MAIPTSRTKVNAEIRIDIDRCSGCGLCTQVCTDSNIVIANAKAKTTAGSVFGCIACGHCMAVCPENAISINGRTMSFSDLIPLSEKHKMANYDELLALMQSRRSIREFRDKNVDDDTIDKILEYASFSPMGLPPSDVHVIVFRGKDKVNAFAKDYSDFLKGMKYITSNWFITLMRPFWGKANDEMFRNFIKPAVNTFTKQMDCGRNMITYDAPLMFYFYGSPYIDPADPIIAATYAMHAGVSLGLGTCMLGAIHPFLQYGKNGKLFREKYGIKYKSREGLFLIMGYPKVHYHNGLKRSFAEVKKL
ncbi:MAG: nitroreductase family protein [Bacteroidales bacterium]|nr:nitroreductase family protein [Bacteroidales bacterium]HOY39725.1 nitroreductase family protein [Bacteroidales bacterium]HQP03309.1 nitroreductase family protein [Bacteroidales bacterium]